MRKPCGASPGRRAGEKPSPAPIMDDGRGWFPASPEGERCEETSPGARHGRRAGLVSNRYRRSTHSPRALPPPGAALQRRSTGAWPVDRGRRGCCLPARHGGQIPPGRHLSRRPGLRVSDERFDPVRDRGLRAPQRLLRLRAIPLDRRLDAAPALPELAPEPVARLARASTHLAPRLGPAPLELVQLALDLRAEALELALGRLPTRQRLEGRI